jgi:site-specific DNA-methyltransferase (adenine-specific)
MSNVEYAWTNLNQNSRQISHSISATNHEREGHPTQKPEAVMRWALLQAPESVKTVLDPFMGSGTTLVACKRLGRVCVGIEREERYCEIAARRLQQEALPLEVA